MKTQSALKVLTALIFILSLIAASAGLFDQTEGEPYSYTNHRGETVKLNGAGLYYFDTVSTAAQMQGNDLITLVVGLPILAVSAWYAFHGSLRGKLLLIGTFGFFLYTYMSMSMLTAYNSLFLIYVVLFGLSLYAFVLSMLDVEVSSLPQHFSPRLPRRGIALVLFAVGGFLTIAWLGRIIGPMLEGVDPALENTTTLVIQAMDLVLIVPLATLAGVFLLRRNAWGYLLASVAVLKGLTMALGVSAMAINMALKGVPDSLGIMIPFLVLTFLNLVVAGVLLRDIDRKEGHLMPA
jgi:hypothetical protein